MSGLRMYHGAQRYLLQMYELRHYQRLFMIYRFVGDSRVKKEVLTSEVIGRGRRRQNLASGGRIVRGCVMRRGEWLHNVTAKRGLVR
jgi:hypothetical protein